MARTLTRQLREGVLAARPDAVEIDAMEPRTPAKPRASSSLRTEGERASTAADGA